MARGPAHLADELKKQKKTVTATDLAKWAGAIKLKADQPRFVDAVHKELSEIVAGTGGSR